MMSSRSEKASLPSNSWQIVQRKPPSLLMTPTLLRHPHLRSFSSRSRGGAPVPRGFSVPRGMDEDWMSISLLPRLLPLAFVFWHWWWTVACLHLGGRCLRRKPCSMPIFPYWSWPLQAGRDSVSFVMRWGDFWRLRYVAAQGEPGWVRFLNRPGCSWKS